VTACGGGGGNNGNIHSRLPIRGISAGHHEQQSRAEIAIYSDGIQAGLLLAAVRGGGAEV
jgi:hypothetical protein